MSEYQPTTTGHWRHTAGTILCRVVVPLWVLTGAVVKLMEHSPKMLPKATFLEPAQDNGLDLYTLLIVLLGLEFFAVAVMFLSRRFARPMAIFMLACFCLILIYEMMNGSSSCGCLGANSPPPWVMLTIDGALLIAVVALGIGKRPAANPGLRYAGIALLTIAGFVISYLVVEGARPTGEPPLSPPEQNGSTTPPTLAPDQPTQYSSERWRRPLPPSGYWLSDQDRIDGWIGKPWYEAELMGYINEKPKDIDTGLHYIVFYGMTCDHCEEMFYEDLAADDGLAAQTTAIEVPLGEDMEPTWTRPLTSAELLQLRTGCDWIITTPLALRIEDGIVTCAQEADHKRCFDLE